MTSRSELHNHIITTFNSISELHGWDFSRLRAKHAAVPWDYLEVVRNMLIGNEMVLDVGTGGGERLISLADTFRSAVGIDADPAMINVANANLPDGLIDQMQFVVGSADSVPFPDGAFDVVLNRHSVVGPGEVVRALRTGGIFINQAVGERNLKNLIDPWRHMGNLDLQDPHETVAEFKRPGCDVLEFREYDVEYVFLDEESLFFQLKAMPMPVPVDPVRDVELLEGLMDSCRGPEGHFRSNEHRLLTIVRKP